MNELVRQVTESKSPLLYGVSEWDVAAIWDSLSIFIQKQMLLQKAVHISGLGTFSFIKKKLDICQRKSLLQRPVFIFSEKLISILDLTCPKTYTSGKIPVVNLNYAAISLEQNSPRDIVENCIKELLSAFCRAINNGRNVDLVFPKIGRLTVRGKKCKMKFYKTFIEQIDESGSLVKSMQNRLNTPDSVISEHPVIKSSTIIIPCPLVPEENIRHSGRVAEEKVNATNIQSIQEEPHCEMEQVSVVPPLSLSENVGLEKDVDSAEENTKVEINAIGEEPQPLSPIADPRTDIAIENIMKTNSGISPQKLEFKIPGQPDVCRNDVDSFRFTNVNPIETPMSHLRSSSVAEEPLLSSQRFSVSIPKSTSAGPISHRHKRSLHSVYEDSVISGCCEHEDTGQEICYLCHQRAQRNVYIPFKEEKAKMSAEEDRLLENYQIMKNTEEALKEKEKKHFLRQELKDIQKVNQEIAHMKNTQKKEKSKNFEPCYLFPHRPLTPPLYARMGPYGRELLRQIEINAAKRLDRQEQENLVGKMEQKKLAEDLARLRKDVLKDKVMRTNMYKKALDSQVQNRNIPSPEARVDTYYFGKYDVTPEMLAEKKQVATEIMNEQCQQVAQQKREAILKRMKEQQSDENILEKNKLDLLKDRALTHKQNYEARKSLEMDWKRNIEIKKEEKQEIKEKLKEAGMLVQDQCKRYARCQQCKRGLRNRGSCNIWTDTFYLPGSRYII